MGTPWNRTVPSWIAPIGSKWLPMPNGKAVVVDEEDFDRLIAYSWCMSGNGYIHRADSRTVRCHRAMLHREILRMNDDDPNMVDHRNGNRLDNRKENLRVCVAQLNLANRPAPAHNTSGYKGVSWHKPLRRWRAFIKVNYRQQHLGLFDNKEEAARAYNRAAREAFGEFAALNAVPNADKTEHQDR